MRGVAIGVYASAAVVVGVAIILGHLGITMMSVLLLFGYAIQRVGKMQQRLAVRASLRRRSGPARLRVLSIILFFAATGLFAITMLYQALALVIAIWLAMFGLLFLALARLDAVVCATTDDDDEPNKA